MKRASALFFCCLIACILFSAASVQAGGFALYEWGHRSIGMATTGYAQGADASVIATNPALMTKLEGKHALAGFTLISPQTSVYLNGDKNKTQAKIFTVPHAYYTQQMESNENVWLGVGVFTRFGLGTYYDENWAGKSGLQYVDVQSVSVNPNIAFKFSDDLSIAVGLEILRGTFDLQRYVTAASSYFSAHTEGYGVGGNIGVSYDFNDQWAAGFTWRAPMKLYTSGRGLSNTAAVGNSQEVSASLPGSYTLGLSYKPIDEWIWEFDVVHTRWEATDKISYSGAINNTTPLHYKNTWRFQLGTEYWLQDYLALRFGYVWDQTPTRAGDASFMLPANDRMLFSTGLGYVYDNWKIDWSFMYVKTKERKNLSISDGVGSSWRVDFKDGQTWITGLSVGYEF